MSKTEFVGCWMLSKRFKNDAKPIRSLNELQQRMKKQVEEKIAEGIYSFEEVHCCVCGGSNFELLSEKDRYGLYHPVVICRDCGLIQTNPRMTQESYNEFYQIEYQKLYQGSDVPTDEYFKFEYRRGKTIHGYLVKILKRELVNLFIVEVGCAAGGVLQYFSEQGNEVYGVDLDTQYIEFGRANYGLNIEVGTIDKVVKLDKSPDFVIYSEVLEHIFDPIAELMKLREIMSQESFVYIGLPGIKNLNRSALGDFLRSLQNAHVYYFTEVSLRNLLGKAGYDFVCGDKVIHSLFRKSSVAESTDFQYESDYQDIMSFLRRLEFTRLLPTPYKLQASFMRMVTKVLKAVGLYDIARKLYHQLINQHGDQ